MNKLLLVSIVLVLSLLIVWFLLFSVARPVECPDELSADYHSCVDDSDCYFNPKYACINVKPLSCVINEDLSARQGVASLFYCKCVDGYCKTVHV